MRDPQGTSLNELLSNPYSTNDVKSRLDVYTATTTILVEQFLKDKVVIAEKSKAQQTWDDAINVLTTFTAVAGSAKKCMNALEVLSKYLLPSDESSQISIDGRVHGALDLETLSEMRRFLASNQVFFHLAVMILCGCGDWYLDFRDCSIKLVLEDDNYRRNTET